MVILLLINNIKEDVFKNAQTNLTSMIKERISGKQVAGITNAVSISQNSVLVEAF